MSRLVHIWIDDNINLELLDNNYTDMETRFDFYWYKNIKINCKYQGHPTTVYFYTSEEVNKKWSQLFLGLYLQKVTINNHINFDTWLALFNRMRSEILPTEGIYPAEEKFVMEIGDDWKILDAHKGGNHREFKSFKGITSAGEFLGLAREMGCPLDKSSDM